MTDYIATQEIGEYRLGGTFHADNTTQPLNNLPISTAAPRLTSTIDYVRFWWTLPDAFGTFADLGIVGFKVVGSFTGTGRLFWDWAMENPGYPFSPQWDADPSSSSINLDDTYDSAAAITVSGPTTYEWTFALTDTASDPTYGGFSFNDPLADLEVSLHAHAAEWSYDRVYGRIAADTSSASIDVTVLAWDLVLFTAAGPRPVTRLWPRDDNLGLGSATRIHPPPRANRIVGGQP